MNEEKIKAISDDEGEGVVGGVVRPAPGKMMGDSVTANDLVMRNGKKPELSDLVQRGNDAKLTTLEVQRKKNGGIVSI